MTDDPSDKIVRLMGKTSPKQNGSRTGNNISVEGSGNFIVGGDLNVSQLPLKEAVTKVTPEPGEKHITEEQKVVLRKLVDEVVETEARLKKRPKKHGSVWKSVNGHCGVTSYSLIEIDKFESARTYLNKWMGRLNSAKSAPVKNGDQWRKRKYAYIKINAKDPKDAEALAVYIKRNFGASSITELANDELEKAYRYVAGRRNRRR